MKKVFVVFTLLSSVAAFAQANELYTPTTDQPPVGTVVYAQPAYPQISPAVSAVLGDAMVTYRIGELPNGDVIFLSQGIAPQEDSFISYPSKECLLIRSTLFNSWEVLAFTPSTEYTMTSGALASNWNISVVFSKNGDTVKANYLIKKRKFSYRTEADRVKVEGTILN